MLLITWEELCDYDGVVLGMEGLNIADDLGEESLVIQIKFAICRPTYSVYEKLLGSCTCVSQEHESRGCETR